jgi:hypothetical protein
VVIRGARFLGQPFGHGPAFENAVLLQAEIEVQRAGLMPLDHESPCYLRLGHGLNCGDWGLALGAEDWD